jgi:hypothetical protein
LLIEVVIVPGRDHLASSPIMITLAAAAASGMTDHSGWLETIASAKHQFSLSVASGEWLTLKVDKKRSHT